MMIDLLFVVAIEGQDLFSEFEYCYYRTVFLLGFKFHAIFDCCFMMGNFEF